MKKIIIVSFAAAIVFFVAYFFRYTYKTAHICIYKIDNFTNKTYFSCQGEEWTLIKNMPTVNEYLNDE